MDAEVKPLAIDLFCGLGGWTEGLMAEGWDVIGFDIERHQYGDEKYPGQLVLQNILTIHGRQFKDVSLIVASPPCQVYSYMAMPWTRAKNIASEYRSGVRSIADLNALFDACFRIQREACEAAGRHIPLIVENVKGAQPWVGRSRWNFGSFHLWGDVPALMPMAKATKNNGGSWFAIGSPGQKEVGQNPVHKLNGLKNVGPKWDPNKGGGRHGMRRWTNPSEGFINDDDNCLCTKICDCQNPEPCLGTALVSNECPVHNLYPAPNPECSVHAIEDGVKNGNDWFGAGENCSLQRRASSGSKARKAASAKIAKIPFPLSQHIARVYYPRPAP